MKKIIITLEITDPETVEGYWQIHKDFIEDDLWQGTLLQKCEMTNVNFEE